MPEFLIRNLDAPPKYARLAPNGRAVTWVGQAAATGFPDAAAARLAFDTACSAMGDRATAKMEEGLADGTIAATPNSWQGNFQRLGKHASAAIDFFAAQWLRDRWMGKQPFERQHFFPDASRQLANDLLGVFETFYVRCADGWLAPIQAKLYAASLSPNASFSLAAPFSSAEAAASAAKAAISTQPFWIVKTSCVFTGVQAGPTAHGASDDFASTIASACEARDIRASLDESVNRRMAEMQPLADAAKKSCSRL